MADVARLAGVTRSTVSYTISGSRPISDETRRRVLAAMEELDYTPNVLAQGLAGSRTSLLGLLVPSEFLGLGVDAGGYLSAAADEARSSGRRLLLLPGPADDAGFVEETVRQGLVDGVVVMEVYRRDVRVDHLRGTETPFVLLGRTDDTAGTAFCDADFDASAESAFTHLAELGHREVALVARGEGVKRIEEPGVVARSRAAEIAAAARHGMGLRRYPIAQTFAAGWEAFDEIRASAATAVLLHNEPAGLGFVSAAAARGVVIPRDLSVITVHTGPEVGELSRPRLTSVGPDHLAMARRAVQFLVRRIDGAPPESLQSLSEPRFIDRGSTAGPA
ncbi:LacI family DNA-binding transcriptional regulator [Tsukamurella spumae]|nr:LacI family DNA-binding transcriptional regulator [Tsukamurella spumae]